MANTDALRWSGDAEKEPHILETVRILRRSQEDNASPYDIRVAGKDFIVFPNVFPASYFNDTEFFAESLPIAEGDHFLEIGPGTGILSVIAACKGATVKAVDINADAVRNTEANAKRHGVESKINVVQGDVYGPLDASEKFNKIFWNVPFGYVKLDLSVLEQSVFDTEYRSIHKFICGAGEHLTEDGVLLIGFSTVMGRYDILLKFLAEADCKEVKEIAKKIHTGRALPLSFEILQATF
jgi:release factor glutamine methyltransferase